MPADQPERLLVVRRGRILHPEQPALLDHLAEPEGLFLLATAPGLVVLVFLARDAANLPLLAACGLPVGPALSAALSALHRPRTVSELRPAAAFVRAYRENARAVLAVWVPLPAGLTVIGTSLAHPVAAGIPVWWSVLLAGIGVLDRIITRASAHRRAGDPVTTRPHREATLPGMKRHITTDSAHNRRVTMNRLARSAPEGCRPQRDSRRLKASGERT